MRKIILTFLLTTLSFHFLSAQNQLVKDFNGDNTDSFYGYDGIVANVGDKVIVKRNVYNEVSEETETKIYAVNKSGTANLISTEKYKDEEYGPLLNNFTVLPNDKLAFVVNTSPSKIIITDGSTAGTSVIDKSDQYIGGIELMNNALYYTRQQVNDDYELAKIDLSTLDVSTVFTGGWFYTISDLSKTNSNTIVFMAGDPDASKYVLYKTDGTTAGTSAIADITSGSQLSQQTVMTNVGDKAFFFFKEPGSDCCNFLWVTDGTTAGTLKIKEFNTISFIDYERSASAIDFGGKFVFRAVDNGLNSNNDQVLWISDGTVAGTKAITQTSSSTKPRNLTVFKNKLYFTAMSSSSYNYKLYETDGTAANTKATIVKNGNQSLSVYDIAAGTDYLYLSGDNTAQGNELFRFDGTNENCDLSEGIAGSSGTDPEQLIVNNGTVFFLATTDATGKELFIARFDNITNAIHDLTEEKSGISLYPNPSKGAVTIEIEKATSGTVTNTLGLTVANISLTEGKNEIQLPLNSGVYFLQLNSKTIKFVIQ